MHHTIQAVRSTDIGPRGLANIVHGAACSDRGKWVKPLFTALERVVQRRMGDFNAQDLAITAWALTERAVGVLRVAEAKL